MKNYKIISLFSFCTTAVLILLCCSPLLAQSKTQSKMTLSQQLTLLNQWFPGEYNNHEQVWLQKGLKEDVVFTHVHHIFYPVEAPKVGKNLYYVQQAMAESKKVFRQRLYQFSIDKKKSAIRLDIFKFKNEKKWRDLHLTPEQASQLTAEEITSVPGCEVYWNYQDSKKHFAGAMVKDQCKIVSSWSKKTMIINDDLILDDKTIYIRDVATDEKGKILFGYPNLPHYRNVKVNYYSAWASVRPLGEKTPLGDGKDYGWNLHKGIKIHSEGGEVSLIGPKGEKLGYKIQLSRVTRPGSRTELLKLNIINEETEKSKAYTWSDPESKRLGINIGWAQVGLTMESKTPYFGFDSVQPKNLVQLLSTRLQGNFSAAAQAKRNKAYQADQMHFCAVQWEDKKNNKAQKSQALVLEYTSAQSKKTQAVVYVLSTYKKDQVQVKRFIPKGENTISCAKNKRIQAKDMEERVGCALYFNYINDLFIGSTKLNACKRAHQGADIEMTDIRVLNDMIYYWKRGLKEVKKQEKGTVVWGAKDGAYEFMNTKAKSKTR